ncbi:glycosyltransferase family 39 protein [Micromonospora sp. FIMYZ51]|uniref:glycosyltransferase family 39 protein n=1 Tax=Micromonospora sp. FIMYZ51 TaxID=3051832 RepID=UPI00311E2757
MGDLSGRSVPATGTGVRLGGLRLRALPVWLVPTGVTLIVTLAGLDAAQPWRDELATWSAATRPVTALLRLALTIDAATVPYYLLMHAWIAVVGDSVAALRLPSALAMAAAAGLTAGLGQRLAGTSVGTLAGLLFAVLPGTSRYAQEARPYALATALAVLSTLLLVDALRRPGWGRWAGYAAASTALGLLHVIALTLLAAHAVAVLGAAARPDRREPDRRQPDRREPDGRQPDQRQPVRWWPVRWWLGALLPVTLAVTPLALLAAGQRRRQLDWVDAARPADLAALPGGVTQSGVVGGVLVGLAALGLIRAGRWALLPASCVLLPVSLLFLTGLVVPLWVPRYLLFVVPFACLLAGAALAAARSPAVLVVVLLAGLLGLPDQVALRRTHEWPRTATVDYRGAAEIVAAGQRSGDAVVYSPRDGWLLLDLGLRYHLRERTPRDVLLIEDQDRRGDFWATECDRPAGCLAGTDRVWLLLAGHPRDPLAALPTAKADALRARYRVTQVWPRPGLTIALLTR